ncbi:hypothetical protein EYB53_023450 [Candidatus Chloroploca sp. M-50]|uniref:Uncharacterized protein n=1 Tax=Candidatus Chloroploca mongolica TaxID=2528176 RepID=A0ABS4DGY3_9CHLR|nr:MULTISPECIES: hypothetical protein [Candidatus Chloroploca]MBP1468690.1 hypothetical protein [Candidatus Chloroploca mongolica]
MQSVINLFPLILLGVMCLLTFILLPLTREETPYRQEERQRTDRLKVPVRDET